MEEAAFHGVSLRKPRSKKSGNDENALPHLAIVAAILNTDLVLSVTHYMLELDAVCMVTSTEGTSERQMKIMESRGYSPIHSLPRYSICNALPVQWVTKGSASSEM